MIIKRLLPLLQFLFASFAFFVSLAAVAGFLGFAIWPLDVFNHFQPLLFPLTFLLFVFAAALAKFQPFRGLMLSICATGFLASSVVVIPELVGAFRSNQSTTTDVDSLKLMTFNIYAKNENLDGLFSSIEAENPDVLLIQEYWSWHRKGLEERISALLPNSVHCQGGKRSFLAIYSKFPLSKTSGHDCVDSIQAQQRTSIIAVSVASRTPFNLVTTHFDWPLPAERQRDQMQAAIDVLNGLDGPTLFGGDFNSTPFSYSFKNLVQKTGMRRAIWLTPTWPAPPTYPFDMPAWLQLDHVLTTSDITTSAARRAQSGGSDHYPLVVEFTVP